MFSLVDIDVSNGLVRLILVQPGRLDNINSATYSGTRTAPCGPWASPTHFLIFLFIHYFFVFLRC